MPHPVFTPTAVPPDRLDDITVGNGDIIDRLVDRLQRAATGAARAHTLVVGARGSGKTHAIAVALHRSQVAVGGERLAVGWIAEDALSIGSYVDLLVEIIRVLDGGRTPEARRLRQARNGPALERLLLDIADDRPLVIVLENLDRIFRALGQPGQHALRGFVETASSVLLIASTPLLFAGVSSRDEPWYGSFGVEHLPAFTADDGATLMRRLASEEGNNELAAFVGSPSGRSRLQAIEHLAGGSPRLWHILSGCATVSALDDLVPAVESLLDELAPYYQQRLWELPSTEQKLVVELGRDAPVRPVRDLAEATGLSAQAAATALGRLAEARWVRARKAPGTDQRVTHYELREPLLRHHLSYRDNRGAALPFVVEFLRVWFSQEERRHYLVTAPPESPVEGHLVHSLLSDRPDRSDQPWIERDPADLLAAARCWIAGTEASNRLLGSRDLGFAIEAVVLAATGVARNMRTTKLEVAVRSAVSAAQGQEGLAAEKITAGLRALRSAAFPPDDQDLLTVMTIYWDVAASAAHARDELAAIVARRHDQSVLTLAVRRQHALLTGEAGDLAYAREIYADLIPDTVSVLGADHPDTLVSRTGYAACIERAGDPAAARELRAELLIDMTRVFGADHPYTLGARGNHAHLIGEAGDPATARNLHAELIIDRARVLGPEHSHTFRSRGNHAHWTGRAGDPETARELHLQLISDLTHALGAYHPDTVSARHEHANWTGEAGDPAAAYDLYSEIAADQKQILGTADPATRAAGLGWLIWTLRCRRSPAPIANALGQPAYAHLTAAGIAFGFIDGDDVERSLDPLRQASHQREVLVALLTQDIALPVGTRTLRFERVARLVPADVSAPLRRIAAAIDGNAEALAGLASEVRSLVQRQRELDPADHPNAVPVSGCY